MDLNDARKLALSLIQELSPGWTFDYDNAQRRFGRCYHHTKHITLSEHLTLINSESEVRNTILHEIAHARVGPNHHHDAVWSAEARRIGCDGKRLIVKAVVPEGKFLAICKECSQVFRRVRPPRKSHSCRRCGGYSFNPAYVLTWVKVV
jgi:predicted SprT family Zn-dependent metalloprotease